MESCFLLHGQELSIGELQLQMEANGSNQVSLKLTQDDFQPGTIQIIMMPFLSPLPLLPC
jgi:hypothetical protein